MAYYKMSKMNYFSREHTYWKIRLLGLVCVYHRRHPTKQVRGPSGMGDIWAFSSAGCSHTIVSWRGRMCCSRNTRMKCQDAEEHVGEADSVLRFTTGSTNPQTCGCALNGIYIYIYYLAITRDEHHKTNTKKKKKSCVQAELWLRKFKCKERGKRGWL